MNTYMDQLPGLMIIIVLIIVAGRLVIGWKEKKKNKPR